jgi:hypothetical protein
VRRRAKWRSQRPHNRQHALTPFLATHYESSAAIAQKIEALAARAEPQARAVFDLNLLLAHPDGTRMTKAVANSSSLRRVIVRLSSHPRVDSRRAQVSSPNR